MEISGVHISNMELQILARTIVSLNGIIASNQQHLSLIHAVNCPLIEQFQVNLNGMCRIYSRIQSRRQGRSSF